MQYSPKYSAYSLIYVTAFWMAASGAAHASVATIICDIYNNELLQNFGPGIATMGVLSVAIAAIFGKASFGMAVMVAVGIAILFGATTVADAFGVSGC